MRRQKILFRGCYYMSFLEKENMFDNQDLNIKSHLKIKKENIVYLLDIILSVFNIDTRI